MTQIAPFQIVPAETGGNPAADYADRLRELSKSMDRRHELRPGQFVRWKPGLRNRLRPEYNQPAIVRAILPAPVFDTSELGRDGGSAGFNEPLDLVLGLIVENGDFVEFHYDRRRFEPAET